jgi:hypothetical protein
MSSESVSVFAKLKEHGLLLQTDANLPNVCALVAGAPVRGSWWAHPHSHEIFRVNCELAEHPDVVVNKLISGNITYLHKALWAAFVAIGRAGSPGRSSDCRTTLAIYLSKWTGSQSRRIVA